MNEQQVWKAQIDLTIFKTLMDQCDEFNITSKSNFIKFNFRPKMPSDDSRDTEDSSISNRQSSADEENSDQIFLETSV